MFVVLFVCPPHISLPSPAKHSAHTDTISRQICSRDASKEDVWQSADTIAEHG